MKKVIAILLIVINYNTLLMSQNAEIKLMIIDTILSRASNVLAIEKPSKRKEYPNRIRIIDLTGLYTKIEGGFFKKIDYTVKSSLPFNLNNGVYRDVIFYKQRKKKSIIKLTVLLCEFEPNYFIKRLFNYDFEFFVAKNVLIVNKVSIKVFD